MIQARRAICTKKTNRKKAGNAHNLWSGGKLPILKIIATKREVVRNEALRAGDLVRKTQVGIRRISGGSFLLVSGATPSLSCKAAALRALLPHPLLVW